MREQTEWTRLDNAAKIFPSVSGKQDTQVFRFACELFEPVDPRALQNALDQAIELFPSYRCVLKHGLFWYYLEQSDICPVVRQEFRPPCSSIYDIDRKGLLFEVTYYHRRINLEVYHVLSDGTGAMQFLRALVYYYLIEVHAAELGDTMPELDVDASDTQKMDDSFSRYYSDEKQPKIKDSHKTAYRIPGLRTPENHLSVIEGVMPVKEVLARAHDYQTTLTAFLTSVFFAAIGAEMPLRARKKPVVIAVPVNLRKYFDSESMRNFFSLINVSYDFKNKPGSLEDIVRYVDLYFKQELREERMTARLNAFASIERNIAARVVPLVVKDFFLRIGYDVSLTQRTATLSNIGKVEMPEELRRYIRLFDVFVSTRKLQICMCSYGDRLCVSFTSGLRGTDIQKRFFRTLTGMGIPVEIANNQLEREK